MTSSHSRPALCQWFFRLASVLDRWSIPRLAMLFLGAVLARGRRTVTSSTHAAKLSDQFRPCYTAVAVAGKKADRIAARLVIEAIKPLVAGAERLTVALDDTPTERYGPHVQRAGVHHNPTPGPAGSPCFYGHVFVVLRLLAAHPAWGLIALPLLAQMYVRRKEGSRRHGPEAPARVPDQAGVCRLLIDPHSAPLRAEPKDHRDLMVAALQGWVQAYDNLSTMPDWLSNGLCRLVTGGGISTRGLFTNHDEVVWSAHRPIILTSINDIVQRPDVIDRSIFLQLQSIAPSNRRREQDLWAEFTSDHARILGGLLDAVATGMRLWSEVRLPELERMADFTHWGEAVAQGVGWAPGTFVSAYRANRQSANSVSLEESLMAQALLQLAKYHGPWRGTLTQFLELIGEWTGYAAVTTPGWPKTPARAAIELRRIASQLRMFGVSVTFERSYKAGRIVTFTPTDKSEKTRVHAW
jgi:hypothetical protein